MMDKLLDLFLKTPAAKRIVRALVDRALIAGVAVLLSWLSMDPDAAKALNADLLEVATTIAPWVVTALFAWLSVRKSKKTELTIETAGELPEKTPRPVIDATVRTLMAWPPVKPQPPPGPSKPPGVVDHHDY